MNNADRLSLHINRDLIAELMNYAGIYWQSRRQSDEMVMVNEWKKLIKTIQAKQITLIKADACFVLMELLGHPCHKITYFRSEIGLPL